MDPLVIGGAALALVWLLSPKKAKRQKGCVDVDPTVPTFDGPTPPLPSIPSLPDDIDDDRLAEIDELLRSFVSDTPRPGHLYLVREGDNLSDVTREALDTVGPHTDQARLAYIYCLSSSTRWNMRFYGTPSNTLSFPKEYLVPVIRTGVRVAFLPRNEDAMASLLEGHLPRMTVDAQTGAPRGGPEARSYGLLWLPPVDPESLAVGDPTCAPSSWDDGSSTINPPPQLFDLLEER